MIQQIKTVATPAVDAVTTNADNTLEILSKVNEFYDSSWNKLLYVLSGAFGLLAILTPIVIQYIQSKTIKASEKELESHINIKVEEAKETFKTEMNLLVNQIAIEQEKRLKKSIAEIKAKIMLLQGNSLFDSEKYIEAYRDFCSAIMYFIECEDYVNLSISLDNLKVCLNHMTKADVERMKSAEGFDIEEILDQFEKDGGTKILGLNIRELRIALHDLK